MRGPFLCRGLEKSLYPYQLMARFSLYSAMETMTNTANSYHFRAWCVNYKGCLVQSALIALIYYQ